MPFGLGAGMAAAGIAGSLLSSGAQRDAAQQAGDAQKAAMVALFAKLDAVGMPPDQSARVILQQYKQAGVLTPELMQQVQSVASNYGNIKQNQQATNFQSQALQRMSQLGQAGLTADESAQSRALQQQAAQQANASQQAIVQNMAARGMQGSGAELAARLGASQNQANVGSQNADQISSMAQQRALQAYSQGSGLAGQMEQQNFGEQSSIANAQDQMNRFNLQNQMAINQQNVNTQNQAQAANLANSQNIANSNVGNYNQESYNQLQRQRQNWLDKLNYAQAYAAPLGAYGQAGANQAQQTGQANSNMWNGMFGSVANGIGTGMMFNAYGNKPSGGSMASGSGTVQPQVNTNSPQYYQEGGWGGNNSGQMNG